MKKVSAHLRANFIQWAAFAMLITAMFTASKRAAVPAIWALGRFVLPILIIYLVFKLIKSRVSGAVQKFQEQMMQGMQGTGVQGRTAGGNGQVLDLCPTCGGLQGPGHKCSQGRFKS